MPMAIKNQPAADFGLTPEQMAGLPKSVNADKMTVDDLRASLERSLAQVQNGQTMTIDEVKDYFRRRYDI